MRAYSLYSLVIILGLMTVVGCNSSGNKVTKITTTPSKPAETAYSDGVRRITITELKELIKNNGAYIVDVRTQALYDAGHIPGSKLIPAAEILSHLDELPKDKLIVTYCS